MSFNYPYFVVIQGTTTNAPYLSNWRYLKDYVQGSIVDGDSRTAGAEIVNYSHGITQGWCATKKPPCKSALEAFSRSRFILYHFCEITHEESGMKTRIMTCNCNKVFDSGKNQSHNIHESNLDFDGVIAQDNFRLTYETIVGKAAKRCMERHHNQAGVPGLHGLQATHYLDLEQHRSELEYWDTTLPKKPFTYTLTGEKQVSNASSDAKEVIFTHLPLEWNHSKYLQKMLSEYGVEIPESEVHIIPSTHKEYGLGTGRAKFKSHVDAVYAVERLDGRKIPLANSSFRVVSAMLDDKSLLIARTPGT